MLSNEDVAAVVVGLFRNLMSVAEKKAPGELEVLKFGSQLATGGHEGVGALLCGSALYLLSCKMGLRPWVPRV